MERQQAETSVPPRSQERYDAVERALQWPMIGLALAYAGLLVVEHCRDLAPAVALGCQILQWAVWGVFVLEFCVLLGLAPSRATFVRTHWVDLLVILLPALRVFRAVRILRTARLLRLTQLAAVLGRSQKQLKALLGRHGTPYVLLIAALLVFAGAGLMVIAEGDQGQGFEDFGDALWWAAATVTAGGCGDPVPCTFQGRVIAVLLMLLGIAVFGVVAASVAAYFIEKDEQEDLARIRAIEEQVSELRGMVEEMHARLCRDDAGASSAIEPGE